MSAPLTGSVVLIRADLISPPGEGRDGGNHASTLIIRNKVSILLIHFQYSIFLDFNLHDYHYRKTRIIYSSNSFFSKTWLLTFINFKIEY